MSPPFPIYLIQRIEIKLGLSVGMPESMQMCSSVCAHSKTKEGYEVVCSVVCKTDKNRRTGVFTESQAHCFSQASRPVNSGIPLSVPHVVRVAGMYSHAKLFL